MSRTDIAHQVRLKLRFTEIGQKGHIWPKSIKHALCISSGTECCGFRCVTVIMQRANYRRRGALRSPPHQDYVEDCGSYAGKEIGNPRERHRRPTTLKPSSAAMLDMS